MILQIYTLIHVLISLIGIVTGFVVAYGLVTAERLPGATKLFLIMTVLTSVTGFFFPVQHFMPSHAVGIVSLVVLAIAIFAYYRGRLIGFWRPTYVVTALMAQWLNVFVLVVQLFEKVPALHSLAPTQTEPPFKVSQLTVLLLFVVLGVLSLIRFRPAPLPVN